MGVSRALRSTTISQVYSSCSAQRGTSIVGLSSLGPKAGTFYYVLTLIVHEAMTLMVLIDASISKITLTISRNPRSTPRLLVLEQQ